MEIFRVSTDLSWKQMQMKLAKMSFYLGYMLQICTIGGGENYKVVAITGNNSSSKKNLKKS